MDKNKPHQQFIGSAPEGAPRSAKYLQDGKYYDARLQLIEVKAKAPKAEATAPASPVAGTTDAAEPGTDTPKAAEAPAAAFDIDSATKDELEAYARAKGVELDKRRGISRLREQVRALL